MAGKTIAGHERENTVISIEEEIRLTAEFIFNLLYHEGEMGLESLREKASHRMPFFDWGIGWLVGKGDIEIISHNGSFSVRRTPPAPVIIPLRGE